MTSLYICVCIYMDVYIYGCMYICRYMYLYIFIHEMIANKKYKSSEGERVCNFRFQLFSSLFMIRHPSTWT